MLKRAATCVALTAGMLLLPATVAVAGAHGAGTTTTTQHISNVVLMSKATKDPCNHAAGTLTAVAATGVMHITTQADGDFWITVNAQGPVTFTPTDPADPSASGHFHLWFGESSNNQNDVKHATATFVLAASDGSHIVVHMLQHLSTNANGVVTVSLATKRVTCS